MTIEVWTSGTTGGFNITEDGVLRYFHNYEEAHARLVSLGVPAQPAAVLLDNSMRKALNVRKQ